jgi:hypothetical protein
MFTFSYKRIAPWAIVLGPPVLFPLVPMPWSFLLLVPVLLVFLPSMRAEVVRLTELIRSSLAKSPAVAPEAELTGPTP